MSPLPIATLSVGLRSRERHFGTLGKDLGTQLQKVNDGPLQQKHSDVFWGTVSQREGGTFLIITDSPSLTWVFRTGPPILLPFSRFKRPSRLLSLIGIFPQATIPLFHHITRCLSILSSSSWTLMSSSDSQQG